MGIDGIGGGGLPPGGPGGPSGPAKKGDKPFAVDGPAAGEAPAPSEALAKLEAGEISLDQYLDRRVDDAVSHLEGKLSAEQLEFVRGELREQLSEDPVLVELVKRTTGSAPADNDG